MSELSGDLLKAVIAVGKLIPFSKNVIAEQKSYSDKSSKSISIIDDDNNKNNNNCNKSNQNNSTTNCAILKSEMRGAARIRK